MWLYRLILALALPAICLRLWRREGATALGERLGGGPATAGRGEAIWLHAASNGELTAARALIEALLAAHPDRHLVITVNSLSARALGQGWALPRTEMRLAPLDFRPALRRFLARTAPCALITIEGEIWPERFTAMAARGRPVLLVSARLSARSLARWRWRPGLARRVADAIRWAAPQEGDSAARLAALGLSPERIGPACNLKLTHAPAVDTAELARLVPLFPREETILAASTHEGEDEAVLRAFAAARTTRPALRLIIAPRHPRRREAIAGAVAAAGFAVRLRSTGALPDTDAPVLIADTLGEMGLWYRLAGLTFVGGSWAPRGGHTPVEPALAGSVVLHGPGVANFAPLYAALDAAGGARAVGDAGALAQAVTSLDESARERMRAAARAVLKRERARRADLGPVLAQLARALG